jgi:hypothetical protein
MPKASRFSKSGSPRTTESALHYTHQKHTLVLALGHRHPISILNHLPDWISCPLTHFFLQIDYALSGSGGPLAYDQIQLLDPASNPPTAALDASASAWELTTQTLLNDWNEELPPQFRQGL